MIQSVTNAIHLMVQNHFLGKWWGVGTNYKICVFMTIIIHSTIVLFVLVWFRTDQSGYKEPKKREKSSITSQINYNQ